MKKQNQIKDLSVLISSRALFDLEDSHQVYLDKGVEAYCAYQREHENQPLAPGVAFNLVRKLLRINDLVGDDPEVPKIEVCLLSRNSADTGLRIFNSIAHHGLPIERAAFTNGESPFRYVNPFHGDLFLSAEDDDVRLALASNHAAARISGASVGANDDDIVRIAFDGDAVLFSDQSERIFKEQGLDAFMENEAKAAQQPLDPGPFKGFLEGLHQIQRRFNVDESPIRTALITARGAPAHERVIRTLRSWDVRLDEMLFLGGKPKREFLEAFGADFFFDDQQSHIDGASGSIASGHVPHGVANEKVTAQKVVSLSSSGGRNPK